MAVFYFKNKGTLLGEVLRDQYMLYQACWEAALETAGPKPVDQLISLVAADFDAEICNSESLIIWHAFWGESSARPHYAAIADAFDAARFDAMHGVCGRVMEALGRDTGQAAALATAIDALTDGLWLRIYLSTGRMDRIEALEITAKILSAMLPEHAEAFRHGFQAKLDQTDPD